MKYKGRVENGVIVLDDPASLAEGAEVRVEVASGEEQAPTLAERLASIIGTVDGLPEDAAVNHDHYLYGAPKR